MLGHFAYGMIFVKSEEEKIANSEGDQKEAEQKKLEKTVVGSKLLMGGFHPRHIGLLSQKALEEMAHLAKISDNYEMREMLLVRANNPGVAEENNEDERLLSAIQNEKEDEDVDIVVNVLQHTLQTKRPFVMHARIGGADGMKISRCAFATMVKFSNKIVAFTKLRDELEFTKEELEDEKDEKKKLLAYTEKLKEQD